MEYKITDEIPKGSGNWCLTPLYKTNVNGSILYWQISFDSSTNEILMTHGHVEGKIRTDRSQVELNQSNRDIHIQSVLEIKQKYKLKYRNECYRPAGESPPENKEPMLAATWNPEKTKLRYPIAVQPKLDGERMIVKMGNNDLLYRKRSNREINHLKKIFDSELKKFFEFIPYNIELDGELYIHGWKLNQIQKIIKNENNISEHVDILIYYIFTFNINEPLPFEKRNEILISAWNSYILEYGQPKNFSLLDTRKCNNKDEIYSMHKYYTSNNFEGTMIYKLANDINNEKFISESIYKSGRSNNLLKHKDFFDEEGIVIDVHTNTGTVKGLVFKIKIPNGKELDMELSMKESEKIIYMNDPNLAIGRKVTYKYQEYSEYQVPRFAVVKCFRDD
jgi:ATP-dependent DNA ligase